jgi:hypothetical protein
VVPTGGQHFNGQAERMIGILKKCLEGTLAGKRCTLGEMGTIVAEAAQMVNSRPIARNTGDPESGGPITPLHLLLGRASVEIPQLRFNEMPKLTQRLQFIEESKKQFWTKWMSQVFGGRMLSHKWTKKERDVAVGDVVLLAEAENDDPTYRMGVVDSVKPGEDGHVRTVSIKYTNPGKTPEERSPPKFTTRPIHKVAVIVPVGYVFEDDHRTEPERVEPPAPAGTNGSEGAAPAQPDSGGGDGAQLEPAQATHAPETQLTLDGMTQAIHETETQPALDEIAQKAPEEPGPTATEKKGPGRPKKMTNAGAGTHIAPGASKPDMGERPRRKAAIRAEENVRRWTSRDPEAWPLLQARADRRRLPQRN